MAREQTIIQIADQTGENFLTSIDTEIWFEWEV